MKRVCAAGLAACLLLFPHAAAVSGPPSVSAASAILVDAESGRVLYEKDAHTRRLIASTTKLMTALVAAESCIDLGENVTVEYADTRTEGSSLYLQVGEQITVEALLYGLLLHSGNDAALALARYCGGDVETFVEQMNQKARELGMADSHFENPNGLNADGHYSTAADMARLGIACMENETVAKIVATRSIALGNRTFVNHNKLLSQYEGCVGMKTGYTQLAGRTLVSAARRDGQLLVCVTLSDPDDWRDHAALFDYGFSTYPRPVLATRNRDFRMLPVAGSLVRFVGVKTASDVYFPLTEGEKVRAEIELPEQVQAPIEAEVPAGRLVFYVGEEPVGETPLVYASSVRRDAADKRPPIRELLKFFFP